VTEQLVATVVSVHAGENEDLSKEAHAAIRVELEGVVGDAHRGFERSTWAGDKQPKGTIRRNERQWSAVSVEELAVIQQAMGLVEPPSATDLGANLCMAGIPELSRLPKGTILRFPSGAELSVEEYNPPCKDMGEVLAAKYATTSGEPPAVTSFPAAAKLTRGIVGVVEVPGEIRAGDEVTVVIYATPPWLVRGADQD